MPYRPLRNLIRYFSFNFAAKGITWDQVGFGILGFGYQTLSKNSIELKPGIFLCGERIIYAERISHKKAIPGSGISGCRSRYRKDFNEIPSRRKPSQPGGDRECGFGIDGSLQIKAERGANEFLSLRHLL